MTNTIAKRQNSNGYDDTFGNVVDDISQNSLCHFFDDNFWQPENRSLTGNVPVNIRETEQQYELDVIAPGCRKEDFRINIEDNILTVSFNHREQHNQENRKVGFVRNEYFQKSFARSFTLDDAVDVNKISASYVDGILHVSLGKNEKAKRQQRSIDIK